MLESLITYGRHAGRDGNRIKAIVALKGTQSNFRDGINIGAIVDNSRDGDTCLSEELRAVYDTRRIGVNGLITPNNTGVYIICCPRALPCQQEKDDKELPEMYATVDQMIMQSTPPRMKGVLFA